ncbi:MAG: hypothetical protein JO061_19200 [Acidobacteriaceae bacterium]|nr:hypothetical protein [Acidobacteriaceae bacterium]
MQNLAVPSGYQYCFSLYVRADAAAQITLTRSGASNSGADSYIARSEWTRIVSSGRLNDRGETLSVSLTVPPGQIVQIFGTQLEPQIAPSQYRATTAQGGVYPKAYWSINEFPVIVEGLNLFSTTFTIETSI